MFSFFKKKIVDEKPVACAAVSDDTPKGRPGRKLTELAQRSHETLASLLGETAQTRAQLLARVTDADERSYIDSNWQNVLTRLTAQRRVRLADGSQSRGRGVSYVKA